MDKFIKLTLLSKDDVLNVLQGKNDAYATDLAIATGYYPSNYVSNPDELKVRKTYYYLLDQDCNSVSSVNESGNISYVSPNDSSGAIRPVLLLSKELLDNLLLGAKDVNGFKEVSFLEYPQYVVAPNIQKKLEKLFNKGKIKPTGKTYSFNKYNYSTFIEDKVIEYEYDNKKYIRINSRNGGKFSDNQLHMMDEYIWIEVSPLNWIVDLSNNRLISKLALVSGISFKEDDLYDGVFENTNVYNFLNNCMLKDLLANYVIKKDGNTHEYKDLNKEIYDVIKFLNNNTSFIPNEELGKLLDYYNNIIKYLDDDNKKKYSLENISKKLLDVDNLDPDSINILLDDSSKYEKILYFIKRNLDEIYNNPKLRLLVIIKHGISRLYKNDSYLFASNVEEETIESFITSIVGLLEQLDDSEKSILIPNIENKLGNLIFKLDNTSDLENISKEVISLLANITVKINSYINKYKKGTSVLDYDTIKNSKLSLLDFDAVSKDSRLSILSSLGIEAPTTDLAILDGAYYSDSTVMYDKSLKGRIGLYYTKSLKNNTVTSVFDKSDSYLYIPKFYGKSCIRPVIKLDSALLDKFNGSLEEIILGEYPQYCPDMYTQERLETLYSDNKLEKTGKTYSLGNYEFYKLKEEICDEYELDGRKFVRVKSNNKSSEVLLSNEMSINDGEYIWVEVLPVTWLIDYEHNQLISNALLKSGIMFSDKSEDIPFEETDIYTYLNTYMLKDMFEIKSKKYTYLNPEISAYVNSISREIELLSEEDKEVYVSKFESIKQEYENNMSVLNSRKEKDLSLEECEIELTIEPLSELDIEADFYIELSKLYYAIKYKTLSPEKMI